MQTSERECHRNSYDWCEEDAALAAAEGRCVGAAVCTGATAADAGAGVRAGTGAGVGTGSGGGGRIGVSEALTEKG